MDVLVFYIWLLHFILCANVSGKSNGLNESSKKFINDNPLVN